MKPRDSGQYLLGFLFDSPLANLAIDRSVVGALVRPEFPGILGHKLALVTRPGYAQVSGFFVRRQIVFVGAGVVA